MSKTYPSRITSIIGTYHLATESERNQGREWYDKANTIALEISKEYYVDVVKVAGVIAALSPNNRWERNVADAEAVIAAYVDVSAQAAEQVTVCTYRANLLKAVLVLKVDSPTIDDICAILNGRKVVAFCRCILGDEESVCIDGHAYSIWAGESIATTEVPSIGAPLYRQITEDYRRAAELIGGMSPAELQAITWVTHRRLRGIS